MTRHFFLSLFLPCSNLISIIWAPLAQCLVSLLAFSISSSASFLSALIQHHAASKPSQGTKEELNRVRSFISSYPRLSISLARAICFVFASSPFLHIFCALCPSSPLFLSSPLDQFLLTGWLSRDSCSRACITLKSAPLLPTRSPLPSLSPFLSLSSSSSSLASSFHHHSLFSSLFSYRFQNVPERVDCQLSQPREVLSRWVRESQRLSMGTFCSHFFSLFSSYQTSSK